MPRYSIAVVTLSGVTVDSFIKYISAVDRQSALRKVWDSLDSATQSVVDSLEILDETNG